MYLKTFIQQNREDWQQLEQMINLFNKNRAKPTNQNIEKFDHLYQKATQNLSYSQTFFPDSSVTVHLNQLVSQAHNIIYQTENSSWKQLRTFLFEKFVGLFLEQWRAILIAALLFIFGGLVGFIIVIQDPLNLDILLPDMFATIANPEELASNAQANQIDGATMSVAIMTNNIKVAILAFAGGITCGLLTVYVMIYNGLLVGALAGVFWHARSSYIFWAYIVPHGVIELLAIFIAGGAGLLMGYKLLVPGKLKRSVQLKIYAMRSVQLLLGTIPLFVIAGIIEGFITPADLSLETKYLVAVITLVAFVGYLLYGRFRQLKRTTV